MKSTGMESSLEGGGSTMRATASQEADAGSHCTSNTSLQSGPDVYEDVNTREVVEWEKPAVGLQQAKFSPTYTSDALVALAYNLEEAKETVSLGQERRQSSLDLALAKGKRHHRHNSEFPSGLSDYESRGPSKGIVRRNWPFRMPSFFTSTLCSRETRGVTSLSSLKFLDYCNMCSLQLIRIANKAIGRGFLPLQAKCEEGKNSLTVKKRIDEATDGNILSVKIMHADGLSDDVYMARLMVVLYIIDRTTGQYLSFRSPGALLTGQEEIVNSIPPAHTRPIVMRKHMRRAMWDEVLLLDLDFKSFLSSNALMLFDLLDTEVIHQGKIHSLAWSFLNPENIGSEILNSQQKEGEELSSYVRLLQLYKTNPLKTTEIFEAKRAGLWYTSKNLPQPPPPVFLQYLLRCKTKCNCTLKVEISPHVRQEDTIPMPMVIGGGGVHKGGDMMKSTNDTLENDTDSEKALARKRRRRGPNEKCLLPTHLLHHLRAGPGGASCIIFSPSGNLLAFAACDEPLSGSHCVVIANPDSGTVCALLHGHCAIVYSLSFSSDGRRILSTSGDGTARIWGQKETRSNLLWSPEVVLQHTPPTFVYTGVFATRTLFPASLSPFSTSSDNVGAQQRLITPELEMIPVITAGFDGKIRMWNAHDGTCLGNLKGGHAVGTAVNALAYDSHVGRLYSGDERGVIVVWRSTGRGTCLHPKDFSVLRRIRHPGITDRSITNLTLFPKRTRSQLLVGAHGGMLRLFDLSTYKLTHDGFFGCYTGTSMIGACCSPDGQIIASGAQDGRLMLWNSSTGSRIQAKAATAALNTSMRAVAWHPTQHVVALAGMGTDAAVLLYCAEKTEGSGEEGVSDQDQINGKRVVGTSEERAVAMTPHEAGVLDPVQQAAESHRREENRQRLREMRIQRLNDRAERMGYHKETSTTTVPVVFTPDAANPVHATDLTTQNPTHGIIGTDNTTRKVSHSQSQK